MNTTLSLVPKEPTSLEKIPSESIGRNFLKCRTREEKFEFYRYLASKGIHNPVLYAQQSAVYVESMDTGMSQMSWNR